MKRGYLSILFLLLAVLAARTTEAIDFEVQSNITQPLGKAPPQEPLTVKRIVSGDTLELNDGRIVRLLGINSPELNDPLRNKQEAQGLDIKREEYESFAQKCVEFLKDLEGRSVILEFDEQYEFLKYRDRWGRLLAFVRSEINVKPVSVPTPTEGGNLFDSANAVYDDSNSRSSARRLLINETLLASGYAAVENFYPFKREPEFRKLEEEARLAKRGIWQFRLRAS